MYMTDRHNRLTRALQEGANNQLAFREKAQKKVKILDKLQNEAKPMSVNNAISRLKLYGCTHEGIIDVLKDANHLESNKLYKIGPDNKPYVYATRSLTDESLSVVDRETSCEALNCMNDSVKRVQKMDRTVDTVKSTFDPRIQENTIAEFNNLKQQIRDQKSYYLRGQEDVASQMHAKKKSINARREGICGRNKS